MNQGWGEVRFMGGLVIGDNKEFGFYSNFDGKLPRGHEQYLAQTYNLFQIDL